MEQYKPLNNVQLQIHSSLQQGKARQHGQYFFLLFNLLQCLVVAVVVHFIAVAVRVQHLLQHVQLLPPTASVASPSPWHREQITLQVQP